MMRRHLAVMRLAFSLFGLPGLAVTLALAGQTVPAPRVTSTAAQGQGDAVPGDGAPRFERQAGEDENRRLVQGAFDRWSAGETAFFEEIVDEAVVWTIMGSGPSAATYTGRAAFVEEAVQPFAARLSYPNRPVFTRIWADGDHVIINWIGEGVARDGAPYRNTYVWIFRMHDGRAVEVQAFLDLPAYDDVLRRVPAPATGHPPG